MKTIFWFIGLFGVTCIMRLFGQTPVPYEIPGLGLSDAQLEGDYEHQSKISIGHGYGLTTTAPGTDSWFRSGQEVHIYPETHLRGEVHANIVEYPIHLKWYAPSTTPGVAIRYKKLELGFSLPAGIIAEINNFVNHTGITPTLNPFNPSEVDVFAVFEKRDAAGNWQWYEQINGFYYNEFIRVINDPLDTSAASQYWQKDTTSCPFRIRYAPPQVGEWRVRAFANIIGHTTVYQSAFVMFKVVDTGADPYVTVGSNKRYLTINDETFFPIGINLPWPEKLLGDDPYTGKIVHPQQFVEYLDRLTHFKTKGINYFRMMIAPWNLEIEFEKINDYSERMHCAWETDRILERADSLNLKIHFNMMAHYPFEILSTYYFFYWDWSPHNSPVYTTGNCSSNPKDSGYCYQRDLGLTYPEEFLSNSAAKAFYKNRLRYMIARYGYSTEIAIFELISEMNNIGQSYHINCSPVKYKPYETSASLRQYVKDWNYEMLGYLKSIGTKQLLAVNYTGKDGTGDGIVDGGNAFPDNSFDLSYVDVACYNHYSNETSRGEKLKSHADEIGDKPVFHSEIGGGGIEYPGNATGCDNGATTLIDFYTSTFSGLMGTGLVWNSTQVTPPVPDRFLKLANFIGGIDFNQENWLPGYSAREGTGEGKAYVSFLKETIGNPRVIGVLVNNTYNWYSMAIPGTPCSLVPPSDNNLHITEVVEDKPFHRIEINIGVSKEKFRTDWYDAYTGYWLGYEIDKTSSGGILRLEYPDLDYTYHPIALFKIIKKDEPIFIQPLNQIQEANSSLQETATNTIVKNEISEIYISPEPVANVSAYPNPTMGITKLLIHPELLGNMWFLSDIYGRILMHGVATSTDYEFDFSSFSKGVYLFKVLTKNESTEIKIIRM